MEHHVSQFVSPWPPPTTNGKSDDDCVHPVATRWARHASRLRRQHGSGRQEDSVPVKAKRPYFVRAGLQARRITNASRIKALSAARRRRRHRGFAPRRGGGGGRGTSH